MLILNGIIVLESIDFILFHSYLQLLSTVVQYHQESNSLSSFEYASQNHNVLTSIFLNSLLKLTFQACFESFGDS